MSMVWLLVLLTISRRISWILKRLIFDLVATDEKEFDYNKFIKLNGAAAASYIKACPALGSVPVSLFDRNGKRLEGSNLWYDVIYWEKGDTPRLYIRLG